MRQMAKRDMRKRGKCPEKREMTWKRGLLGKERNDEMREMSKREMRKRGTWRKEGKKKKRDMAKREMRI